jgi:hypothetical protein
MAYTGYGAKYTLSFSDIYQTGGGQYIATIYKKGYSGDVIEINGDSSPVVIETDSSGDSGYRPFIATKASLNLIIKEDELPINWDDVTDSWDTYVRTWNESGFNFTEFITAGIDTFLLEVKIKQPGDTYKIIWQGYYIYNTDVSISEITPIKLTLQFSDTLLMKVNKFYNFPSADISPVHYFPSDKISLEEAIMRCVYFSGITDTVIVEFPYSTYNTYRNNLGSDEYITTGLSGMYIQKNAFLKSLGKYQTIYDVLTGICSQFGLIAYHKDNKLHIKSYQNLMNATTRSVTEYLVDSYDEITDTVDYTVVDDYTENDSVQYLNESDAFKNIGRDQTIKFNYPVREVAIQSSASTSVNTPNHTMASISQIYYGGGIAHILNSWYSKNGSGELIPHMFDLGDVNSIIAARPFSPFALFKTETTLTHFATRFPAAYASGFNVNDYIDSEPFNVSAGDAFSLSYSAFLDGRFKNLSAGDQVSYRPKPVVALVLLAKDGDGNEVEYFYNYTTGIFDATYVPTGSGSLPLITTTNYNGTDADWIHYDLKGALDIPDSAKLKIRQYHPYRTAGFYGAPDSYQLFVEYCNLQTFKQSPVSGLPTTQIFRTYYDDVINSDESITLESNISIMDATRYTPETSVSSGRPKNKNPMFVPSCYANTIIDEFNSPAANLELSYVNPSCINISYDTQIAKFQSIVENILKNAGVNNVTIDGTYKSDATYFIGNKFRYEIIGYYEVTFALMDYQIDLKGASYSALLYSSEFTDVSGKTTSSQTVIS